MLKLQAAACLLSSDDYWTIALSDCKLLNSGVFTGMRCTDLLSCLGRALLHVQLQSLHGSIRSVLVACLRWCFPCAGGMWGKMSSWLGKSPASGAAAGANLTAEEDPECIHIFTVASGLMYERLQKIMVLSVLRSTK